MKPTFIKLAILIFVIVLPTTSLPQEPKTIKIKKESNLAIAVFDNTEFKLTAIDRFGNPKDNKIASYKLYVQTKKNTKEFTGYGNNLSPQMITYLNNLKTFAKLFFTEINAEEDDTHITKLPDVIDQWFPKCKIK